MEGQGKGAIAFARTGDPQLGEWDDAAILGRYGDVPDDLAATWVAPQFMTGSGLFRIAIRNVTGTRIRMQQPIPFIHQ